ncbi:MCP four helix bundle domain-containing protein [Methylobacterium nigriterrae]|uniref:MCP four helix bundle domain-containing protein n=1 Tax=Methylobacterium nigriterrae TaxID=3127512 RepID=UPI0030140F63
MRLSVKLILASLFGLSALISAGQGLVSLRDLAEIQRNAHEIGAKSLPSVNAVNRINTAIRDYRVKLYRFVVASETQKAFADSKKVLAATAESLAKLRREYEPLITSAEEKELYGQFSAAWSRYLTDQQPVLDAMEANRRSEALALLVAPELAQRAKEAADALQQDVAFNKRAAETGVAESIASAATATRTALIAMAVAILASLGAALFSLLGISRPIERMTSAMRRLAGGDTSVAVPSIGRKDEIGAMADAVQVFKDGLIRMRALEEETALARAGAEAQRKAAMHEMADRFEAAIGGIVGLVSAAATELQATAQSMSGTAAETASQSTTVAAAAEEAASNVSTVAAAAEETGAAAGQVLGAASELSRQSEHLSAEVTRFLTTVRAA